VADLPIDPLRLGDRLEPVVESAHRLGAAEQEDAALAERAIPSVAACTLDWLIFPTNYDIEFVIR
jgi:hypothetical protein